MFNTDLNELIQSVQIGYNATFELNEFGEPKIKSEIETVKDILMFILLTKPGQYPSLPSIGYDIESKLYTFYDELTEDDIVEGICSQCAALRSYFNNGTIVIKKYIYNHQPSIVISVSGTETYPKGYMNPSRSNSNRYLIGLSYDDMHKLIYDIKKVAM